MRVRCMTMQRDEVRLIDAWCAYHGHLFGFESLTIFDNGSVLPETVEVLRRYERAGCTIVWQFRSNPDYAERQRHFDAFARSDDGSGGLAIGLDCDEWLALFGAGGLTCDRDEIMAYLDRPGWQHPGAFGIDVALLNVPTTAGYFCSTSIARRCLSPGEVADATLPPQSTDLVVIRFRNRPFIVAEIAAAKGTAPFVHLVDASEPKTPAQCRQFFAGKLLVEFPALSRLADALGAADGILALADQSEPAAAEPTRMLMPARSDRGRKPVEFDAEAYLRLNPDVAGANWPALHHFIRLGLNECRRWE